MPMTRATSTTILLMILVFTGLTLVSGCNKPTSTAPSNEPPSQAPRLTNTAQAAQQPKILAKHVIVYYFHGTRRCRTCLGIQNTIKQTINKRFPQETASGKLTFKEVNIDEEANKHLAKEYQISFSTMIVAVQNKGKVTKWENGQKTWDYAHSPKELMDYTESLIRKYLESLKGK
jgi:hypothetical protein